MILSNRIKQTRKQANLTLVQLSELSNIPRSTLSRYENFKSEPKRDVWDNLAEILNVTPAYLAGYKADPTREIRDDVHLTKEYESLEFYQAYFNSGVKLLENSKDFNNDILEGLTNTFSSLGLLYSNFKIDESPVTTEIIVSISKIINAIAVIGIGIEYTDNKTFSNIFTPLDHNKEEVLKKRHELRDKLTEEINILFESLDSNISEIVKENLNPTIFNVIASSPE